MFTKTFKILSVCLTLSVTIFSQSNNPVKIIQNWEVLTSYQGPIISRDNVIGTISNQDKLPPVTYESNTISFVTTELNINARTVYDLQSNGCIRYIWQCPTNFLQMYAIFTHSSDPASWPDRNVRAFYTSNSGTTWDYLGAVSTSRAGFGFLTGRNDCRGVVFCHTANAPSGDVQTQMFTDLAPGAGTWTACALGIIGSEIPIWPNGVVTQNNYALVVSSVNATQGQVYRNVTTNSGCTFSGWVPILNAVNANSYSTASSGNTLGVTYLTSGGGINYVQSTDNGITWSSPVVIRNYNPADSTGTLRSIDMVFQNGQPKVFFGVCKVLPVAGSFFPNAPSFVYIWSPNINGGNPVLVDSSQGLRGRGEVDVFTSVCRGTIGTSTNGVALYAAWNRARLSDTSANGIHFFDVWFALSTNDGATWTSKTRLTNISGPLKDNRWVSISPTNNGGGTTYFVYLVHQQDSIPGTYVNMQPVHTSYMMHTKITVLNVQEPGIKQIGTEIPKQYSLEQNYPNPFNPKTIIRFDVTSNVKSQTSNVKLVVYDALGKEIAVLVNEQLQPGTYEVDFDGSNFASGLYYYKLIAGDFTETKKMVLIK